MTVIYGIMHHLSKKTHSKPKKRAILEWLDQDPTTQNAPPPPETEPEIVMNALYLCVIAKPWLRVIQDLERKRSLCPKYIVAWEQDLSGFQSANFGDSFVHSVEKAWKGIGFPVETQAVVLDEEICASISIYEITALKMMDRLDPDLNSFSFQMRKQFFYSLVGRWLSVIDEKGIELVISPSIPHRVFDYALYVACKIRDTRFIMFQMVSFGSWTLVIEDIDRMPKLRIPGSNYRLSPEVESRIQKVTKDYDTAMPRYERIQLAQSNVGATEKIRLMLGKILRARKCFTTKPNTYWVKKGLMPEKVEYTWIEYFFIKEKRRRFVKKLRREYRRASQGFSELEFNNGFVFVALHYQPEETTCPSGGAYVDQVLLVRLLNEVLPSDVAIVIKEHRAQHHLFNESASGRNWNFYQEIDAISKRIYFAPVNEDPFSLIDRAIATVTVSGTIGWESSLRGTPAIIFGRAWYEAMPGVFKVKSKLELEVAWKTVVRQKGNERSCEILQFHKAIEFNAIKAKHYKGHLMNDDVDFETSQVNLVNGIIQYLNQ